MSRRITQLLTILLVSSTTIAEADYWDAGAWIDTGDARMRHRMQYLGDNNLIKAPLTTWPLNTVDVYTSMPTHAIDPDRLSPHLGALYLDSRELLKSGLEIGLSPIKVNISGTTESYLVRGFDDAPRDEVTGYVDAAYTGKYATGRLKLWGVYSDDDRYKLRDIDPRWMGKTNEFRFDESYLSVPLGNWVITPGAQTRWWGPGWDGSLIMSNNGRAFPGVSLQRQSSRPFETPWLSWIGPWSFTMFHGQLEEDRFIPNTKMQGMRFTFKPWETVEFGLSKVSQWGGDGRSNSLSDFFDVMFNTYGDDNNTVGNSLAGFDARWRSPFMQNAPFAIYGQMIGEDEFSNLPAKYLWQVGAETWGYYDKLKGSYRLYLEYANTVSSFDDLLSPELKDTFNIAYNHSVYRSGYRYQNDVLGHAIDSDSNMISVAAILDQDNGMFWKGWFKYADLNRDETGFNTIARGGREWTSLGVSMETSIARNFRIKVGGFLTSDRLPDKGTDTGGGVFASLTSTF
jgi:hypothetical protein